MSPQRSPLASSLTALPPPPPPALAVSMDAITSAITSAYTPVVETIGETGAIAAAATTTVVGIAAAVYFVFFTGPELLMKADENGEFIVDEDHNIAGAFFVTKDFEGQTKDISKDFKNIGELEKALTDPKAKTVDLILESERVKYAESTEKNKKIAITKAQIKRDTKYGPAPGGCCNTAEGPVEGITYSVKAGKTTMTYFIASAPKEAPKEAPKAEGAKPKEVPAAA